MAIPLPPFMHRALELAQAAADAGEVPVGAVITKDGVEIAAAANRMRASPDPTAHADMEAIRAAARALGTERLEGCAAADPKGGGVDHGPRLVAQPTCHHRPEVYSGLGEAKAAAQLRAFFADRR